MNVKAEANDARFDLVKWLVVAALVVVAVVGNQYYSAEPILYRVLAVLAIGVVAAFVALQTSGAFVCRVAERSARRDSQGRLADLSGNHSDYADRGRCRSGYGAAVVGLDSLLGWLVSMVVG